MISTIALRKAVRESRTLQQAGERLGITRERVRQLCERRGIEKPAVRRKLLEIKALAKLTGWPMRLLSVSDLVRHPDIRKNTASYYALGPYPLRRRLRGLVVVALWRRGLLCREIADVLGCGISYVTTAIANRRSERDDIPRRVQRQGTNKMPDWQPVADRAALLRKWPQIEWSV